MRIMMIWSENLNKSGSGRTHFVHLAQSLAERGHHVEIVAPGYRPRSCEALPVPVTYLPVGRRSVAAFLWFHILLIFCLPWLLVSRRVQVVYTRGLFHSFMVHGICRLLRVRYVAEINSMVDAELSMRQRGGTARLIRWLDRWNLRWASAFVTVTPRLREEMILRGARAQRVVSIHNGAAVDLFVPGDQGQAREGLGLSSDGVLIGFIGTLAAWQGLDLLVDAARLLPEEVPWQMLIVGQGEEREGLQKQVESAGLAGRVRILPAVPHGEVPRLVQALDMVVIPIHDSRKLKYGLSALKFWEALSVGVPVLVPDAGGLGHVLRDLDWPGEFRTGDAGALASAIVDVTEELPRLRGRRQVLHERIRREHSWGAVAAQTEKLFEALLEGREDVSSVGADK